MSPSMTPSRFWLAAATTGVEVFSRNISDAFTLAGWLRPGTPVRKAVTRSLRGILVGALTPALEKRISRSAGNVGFVT